MSGRWPGRWWAVLAWAWLLLAGSAAAQPLVNAGERVDLAAQLQAVRLAPQADPDPQALWAAEGEPAAVASAWGLDAGHALLGRARLVAPGSHAVHVLELPALQVDDVRVWVRGPGQPWQAMRAGDRVPLSAWPFDSPYPAFPLLLGPEPVDLIVLAANAAPLRVPVVLLPDAEFRGGQVRRAYLSGTMLGLGAMILIVCVLGALYQRTAARWLLAGVAAWVLFTVSVNNGTLALWLTGDWPVFNDVVRQFSVVVLCGLMVLLTAHALDPLELRGPEPWVGIGAAAAALAYAVAQLAWLPLAWRPAGAVASATLAILLCVVLGLGSLLRGGRHALWVLLAAAFFALGVVAAFGRPPALGGLDVRAAATVSGLYLGVLMLRQGILLRERHGRDVLGRASTSAQRDPLTALWSSDGFQQRHAEAALREAAGQGSSCLMLVLLPGLPASAAEHGMQATERVLVRLAAALQSLLGRKWAVARLSESRFAAISARPMRRADVEAVAMQLVTHCARVMQPLNMVTELDLRVVCFHGWLNGRPLGELLRQMKEAGLALEDGRRIAHLGSTATAATARVDPQPAT